MTLKIADSLCIENTFTILLRWFVLTVGHCKSKTKQDKSKKSNNNKRFVDGALSLAQSGCQTNRIIDLWAGGRRNVFEGAYASVYLLLVYCWLRLGEILYLSFSVSGTRLVFCCVAFQITSSCQAHCRYVLLGCLTEPASARSVDFNFDQFSRIKK